MKVLWRSLPTGRKHRTKLPVDGDLSLPLLVVRGVSPGTTLVVSANVHGDEYEGVRAIFELFDEACPETMAGDLVMIPVVNPPAFWAATRCSPEDGMNLARVFPGNPNGSITERIAFHFAHSVIATADFYLDLHSGGIQARMPSMVGFSSGDARSGAAAEIFGAAVTWAHETIGKGRSVSFANDHQIPWLYTEARGAGRIHPEDLAMMKRGIRNLLVHLGMTAAPLERQPITTRLHGSGDIDNGIVAAETGFFVSMVSLLDRVTTGQLLGRLVDPSGEELETYHAPKDGIIGLIRELPVVRPADPLFLVAEER